MPREAHVYPEVRSVVFWSYPFARAWQRLQELHAVSVGDAVPRLAVAKELRPEHAPQAFTTSLACALGTLAALPSHAQSAVLRSLLDQASAAHKPDGLESLLISALNSATASGQAALAAEAKALFGALPPPRHPGGGRGFVPFLDVANNLLSFLDPGGVAELFSSGPTSGLLDNVGPAFGSGLRSDVGLAPNVDDQLMHKEDENKVCEFIGVVAGAVAGFSAGSSAAVGTFYTGPGAGVLGAAVGASVGYAASEATEGACVWLWNNDVVTTTPPPDDDFVGPPAPPAGGPAGGTPGPTDPAPSGGAQPASGTPPSTGDSNAGAPPTTGSTPPGGTPAPTDPSGSPSAGSPAPGGTPPGGTPAGDGASGSGANESPPAGDRPSAGEDEPSAGEDEPSAGGEEPSSQESGADSDGAEMPNPESSGLPVGEIEDAVRRMGAAPKDPAPDAEGLDRSGSVVPPSLDPWINPQPDDGAEGTPTLAGLIRAPKDPPKLPQRYNVRISKLGMIRKYLELTRVGNSTVHLNGLAKLANDGSLAEPGVLTVLPTHMGRDLDDWQSCLRDVVSANTSGA